MFGFGLLTQCERNNFTWSLSVMKAYCLVDLFRNIQQINARPSNKSSHGVICHSPNIHGHILHMLLPLRCRLVVCLKLSCLYCSVQFFTTCVSNRKVHIPVFSIPGCHQPGKDAVLKYTKIKTKMSSASKILVGEIPITRKNELPLFDDTEATC